MSCEPITKTEAVAESQAKLAEILADLPFDENYIEALSYCYSRIRAAINQGAFRVEVKLFPDYLVVEEDNFALLLNDAVQDALLTQGFTIEYLEELRFSIEWEVGTP